MIFLYKKTRYHTQFQLTSLIIVSHLFYSLLGYQDRSNPKMLMWHFRMIFWISMISIVYIFFCTTFFIIITISYLFPISIKRHYRIRLCFRWQTNMLRISRTLSARRASAFSICIINITVKGFVLSVLYTQKVNNLKIRISFGANRMISLFNINILNFH